MTNIEFSTQDNTKTVTAISSINNNVDLGQAIIQGQRIGAMNITAVSH